MTDRPYPRPIAAFRGPVRCQRLANSLTLSGLATDSDQEPLILTFSGSGLPEMPAALAAAEVLALDEHRYRIVAAAGSWLIEARAAHVHRAVGNAFYRAIPPRRVPLRKRLFWRMVLALAGTRGGRRLLSSLRGG